MSLQVQGALSARPLLCLTEPEVIELTGKVRPKAQRRALRFMGIDHKERPDGSTMVLRSQLEVVYGAGKTATASKRTEPNWN